MSDGEFRKKIAAELCAVGVADDDDFVGTFDFDTKKVQRRQKKGTELNNLLQSTSMEFSPMMFFRWTRGKRP